jgi:hypothetical protein
VDVNEGDLVIVLVGLMLCFLGVGSVHLGVPASGFAIGWLLAESFGASPGTAVLIALGCAATAWIVVTLIFRAAGFFVGAIAGGVIGVKIYSLLEGGNRNVLLAALFVLACAALGGFLTDRFRSRFLIWICALGGAGLALSGVGRAFPAVEGWVHHPGNTAQAVVGSAVWIGLAVAGWWVQRKVFPRAGRSRRDR